MNSDTSIDPHDPRLSAYVLGELPPEEALVVEAQLRRSPDAQAEIADLEEMSDLLRDSFAAELSQAQSNAPALSVLPSPESDKVVNFEVQGDVRKRQVRLRIAAIAGLAATLVFSVVMLPGVVPKSEGTVESESALPAVAGVQPGVSPVSSVGDDVADELPVFQMASAPPPMPPRQLDSRYPDGSPVHLVKTGFNEGFDSQARPLGNDPSITKVRFLSDDPIDLRSTPLPAALLGYLPDERIDESGAAASDTSFQSNPRQGKPVGNTIYIDQNRYPAPELIRRQSTLEGAVFQSDGERTRSLYRTEQISDGTGRTSVILKGMIRLEAGDEIPVTTTNPFETDSSYDLEVIQVSSSLNPANDHILNLPSGAMLRKMEPVSDVGSSSTGSGDSAQVSDIGSRYVVGLEDRTFRAIRLAELGVERFELNDYNAATSKLEIALQILPDAPATRTVREKIQGWLETVYAAQSGR